MSVLHDYLVLCELVRQGQPVPVDVQARLLAAGIDAGALQARLEQQERMQ